MSWLKKHRRRLLVGGVLLVAAGLCVYGGSGLLRQYQATHNPRAAIPTQTVTHSTDTPDETPLVEACAAHRVGADEPRRIDIPAIGVSGCVQKVGLDQHGAIAVPTNVHLAGWYANSVLPGEPGISVIDGHVHGRYAQGIFAALHQLQTRDEIRLQHGDGTWRSFRVLTTESYATTAATAELFEPVEATPALLVLITCGGKYDVQAKSYDQRIIVRAAPVE